MKLAEQKSKEYRDKLESTLANLISQVIQTTAYETAKLYNNPLLMKKMKETTMKKELEKKYMFIGKVTNYYPKIGVIAVKITEPKTDDAKPEESVENITRCFLQVGDTIRIIGKNVDFEQQIKEESFQKDNEEINIAYAGSHVGIKSEKPVNRGAKIYKIPSEMKSFLYDELHKDNKEGW